MEKYKKTDKVMRLENVIADALGIEKGEIQGTDRSEDIATARHVVWAIAYLYFNYGYKRIGRMYGRDHSSIMYAVKKMRGKQDLLDEITERIEKAEPGLGRQMKKRETTNGVYNTLKTIVGNISA